MCSTPFIGRAVTIIANSFVQIDLAASIAYVSDHDRKFLLNLSTPITISGVTYTHAVASPRLSRDELNMLLSNGTLGCSVTWVSKERFDKSKPIDLTWWRGGAAAITDVRLS